MKLKFVLIALVVLGLVAPLVAQSSAKERVLDFPAERSAGKLFIREQGARGPDTWERHADAKGKATIPAGSEVRLLIDATATDDLTFLFALPQDAVDDIVFWNYPLKSEQLSVLKNFPALQGLAFDGLGSRPIQLTDEDLKLLEPLKNLRRLDLSGSPVTGAGLSSLRGKPIERLDLTRTMLSDEHLPHLKHLPNLEVLRIGSTQVTDFGVGHLQELRGLKELVIVGTAISEQGAGELKETLRKTTITATQPAAEAPAPKATAAGHVEYHYTTTLPAGTHQYKFFNETTGEWLLDPLNPAKMSDGMHENSVLTIPGGATAKDGTRSEWPQVDDGSGTVKFRFDAEAGQTIHVLGAFNDWTHTPSSRMEGGSGNGDVPAPAAYELVVILPPGEHTYKFHCADDQTWYGDSLNPMKEGETSFDNSKFLVPGGATDADGNRSDWPKVNDQTGKVTFRCEEAVSGKEVYVLGSFNNWTPSPEYQMLKVEGN